MSLARYISGLALLFNRYPSIRIDFLLPADLEFMTSFIGSLAHRVACGV